jgi:hypothetical protein
MIYPFVLSQSMDVSHFPTACEIDREVSAIVRIYKNLVNGEMSVI